jgi:8-amino-7-oxononanoate synthase
MTTSTHLFSKATSEPSTFVDVLRYRALHQPEQQAYTFLKDGESEEVGITYGELDRQARAIAVRLRSLCAPQDRALLLYPPGLEYIAAFFGCLYAGVIAVPTYVPSHRRNLSRVQAIATEAQTELALTITPTLSKVKHLFDQATNVKILQWLPTDNIASGLADQWQDPAVSGNTVAFLQYTSGSTAAPKGSMISHENLMHNSSLLYRLVIKDKPVSRGVIWLPPYHDLGLIGGILQPLYCGHLATLMSPLAFLQHPIQWLQVISRTGATHSGGPNFAYDLCIRKITPEQRATLNLSSWEVAFNGAEPIRPETLDRFVAAFGPCGFRREAFYPSYGLAEATLVISCKEKAKLPVVQKFKTAALEQNRVVEVSEDNGGTRTLVSCGRNLGEQKIIIVDPESLTQCSSDQVGEIWVSGPSVAQGYWNRTEETKYTFLACVAETGEGPFLRTGDLGFLKDGELFVTGRIKDLIIIRGRNLYPQDIELTVERTHPSLPPNCGAVFSVDVAGEERLVVVQEVERHYRNIDMDELLLVIRQMVALEHDVQVYAVVLIKPGSIPKTSSGKIQRHACRARFLAGNLEAVGEWKMAEELDGEALHLEIDRLTWETLLTMDLERRQPMLESHLLTVFARILRLDKSRFAGLDSHQPLNTLGLDSLMAVEIRNWIRVGLGVDVPPMKFTEGLSIAGLATFVLEQLTEPLSSFSESLVGAVATSADEQEAPVRNNNEGDLAENARQISAKPVRMAAEVGEVPPEHYRFELCPEYLNLQQLIQKMQAGGIANPYFKAHEGINKGTTIIGARELINYSSYNYLGLSGDPKVSQAAKEAIERYGTSVSASRLASGEMPLHRELEKELADLVGAEDCIVYVGGHATNETTIGHLFGPGDLILHDSFIHNSVIQGCLLSGARRLPFPHNDWQALDNILQRQRSSYRRALIVIEGVYSMDGDIPDLPKFIASKKRHKTFLMVDEAHSIGVLGKHGRGIGEHFGVDPSDVDLWMGTLSKSFASCGGYIAGSEPLVEYLKYTAPGFVYSVGVSPPNAAAALAAIRLLKAEPERVASLQKRAKLFLELAQARGLNTGTSKDSPVIPILVGSSVPCIQLSHRLFDRGINVQPMIYPAVPDNDARLRFFISCMHTEAQIFFTLDTLAPELAKILQGHDAKAFQNE